jgi:hypothetical protein
MWSQPLTFQVNNGNLVDTPTIQSATISSSTITNGGVVMLTVVVNSVSPPNFLNSWLDGPNGNIYGGGHGKTFTQISANTWQCQEEYTVSQYAPSGTYTYSKISVENANQKTSTMWSQPLTFQVNTIASTATQTTSTTTQVTATVSTSTPTIGTILTTIPTTTTAPNTTITTATTTIPTTTVTTFQTNAPIVTTFTTPIPSPTTKSTVKVTVAKVTPWPTDTPTQSSPLGIEIGIIVIIGVAFLVMKRK